MLYNFFLSSISGIEFLYREITREEKLRRMEIKLLLCVGKSKKKKGVERRISYTFMNLIELAAEKKRENFISVMIYFIYVISCDFN